MKLSTSSINTLLRCGTEWKHTYIDKVEPIDDDSFEAAYGRAFHSLVEGDENWAGKFGAKWQGIIQAHYAAHQARWSKKHAGDWWLSYHAHEIKFKFELAPGYEYHGIIDGVADWNGKNYLVESKTTGSELEKFYKYKEHSIQQGLYLLAAAHTPALQQYNIQGLIYDVTRRPGIRQKKRPPESDADYTKRISQWYFDERDTAFGRRLIERDDVYLHDLAADLMTATDVASRYLAMKNRDSCYKFGRRCGFFPVCFEGESIDNTELYQVRKHR